MALSSPYRKKPWTPPVLAATVPAMDDYRSRVGERLLALRRERGWSQEDAAHAIGVAVKTWGNWERGTADPYESNWRRIGEIFGKDPVEIRGARPATPDPFAADTTTIEQQLDRIETKLDELPDSQAVDELRQLIQGLRDSENQRIQALGVWQDEFDQWRGDEAPGLAEIVASNMARITDLENSLADIKVLLLTPAAERDKVFEELVAPLAGQDPRSPEERRRERSAAIADLRRIARDWPRPSRLRGS